MEGEKERVKSSYFNLKYKVFVIVIYLIVRVVDSYKTVETNFNSLNNLHTLSAKVKAKARVKNTQASSAFLSENPFEKEKVYRSIFLRHLVEEKFLKTQMLKEVVSFNSTKKFSPVQSKKVNSILLCIGPKSLVLSSNKFGALPLQRARSASTPSESNTGTSPL